MLEDSVKFVLGLVAAIIAVYCLVMGPNNLDHVKQNAAETLAANGYTVEGYIGYQWGFKPIIWSRWGGATVYYHLSRADNDTLYSAGLRRWGEEIHIYNVKAVDAFRPN